MKKIGELLKKEREARGISIHEIGMSLKINPKILKAIEEGDEKNLPSKTFLRGFVRSYAQYLRLNVDEVLNLFHEEMGSTKPEDSSSQNQSSVENSTISSDANSNQELSSTKLKSPSLRVQTEDAKKIQLEEQKQTPFTIIGAIVLVVIIGFVASMIEKYSKEAQVESVIESIESTTTTIPMTPSATSSQEGNQTPDQSVSSSTTTVTTIPAIAPVVHQTTSTTTTTMPTTTTTIKTIVSTTTSTTSSTSTTTSTLAKAGFELIIEAKKAVVIKYSIEGSAWRSVAMQKDQFHRIKSAGKLDFEVDDGGGINLIVNGRDRGTPGSNGSVFKVSYP